MSKIRTYNELKKLKTFDERYEYLKLNGVVAKSTFGFDRHLNQEIYHSNKWRSVREKIIIRDSACDLGIAGYEINDKIIIHHMNPISPEDIEDEYEGIFDPEVLICVSDRTHLAIHFSDKSLLPKPLIVRYKGDTTLWKAS